MKRLSQAPKTFIVSKYPIDKLPTVPLNTIKISEEKKKEINYSALERVLAFGNKTVGNETLKDKFAFKNTSLWYYHKHRIYFFIRNLSYQIEELNQLGEKYGSLRIYTDSPFLKLYPFSFPTKIFEGQKNKRLKRAVLLKYIIFFSIRLLCSFVQRKKVISKKHLIIDHPNNHQPLVKANNFRETISDNRFIGYLLQNIGPDFGVIDEVPPPKLDGSHIFKFNFITNKHKRPKLFGEYVIFRGLLNANIKNELRILSTNLNTTYQTIGSLELDPYENLMAHFLKSLHKTSLMYSRRLLSYDLFFSKNHYKTITTVDENSPQQKSILDAAKSNGMKTLGIQHGAIYPLHLSYMFTKEDSKYNPMPDLTLTWGKAWEKTLINKGNYNPEMIKSTGQIRTDIIPLLTNNASKGVAGKDKTIIYASQPQRDPELREQALRDVLWAAKDLKKTKLIIKPHPLEIEDPFFTKAAQEVQTHNYEIVRDIDLYVMLSSCDALITCFSTVGSEAVYFKKPLIIHDPLDQDILGYHKAGVAYQALNKEQLHEMLKTLDDKGLPIHEKSYEDYIKDYAFKIDGFVHKRCLEAIQAI